MDSQEDQQAAKRFNPFRSFSRGFKAACRWTIFLGRGRPANISGRRARRRGRRGAPPLASLSAAILAEGDVVDFPEDGASSRRQLQARTATSLLDPTRILSEAASTGGSVFPLVLTRPLHIAHASPGVHQHPQSLSYHIHAEEFPHPQTHHCHHPLHRSHQRYDIEGDDEPWTHYHTLRPATHCSCGGSAAGTALDSALPASSVFGCGAGSSSAGADDSAPICQRHGHHHHHHHNHHHHHEGEEQQRQHQQPQPGHSVQQLLAVGSRQWGGGSWWDGRGLLRVKIYDFAIYADPAKAAQAVLGSFNGGSRSVGGSVAAAGAPAPELGLRRSSAASASSAAQLLVSPSSGVEASLTIRACRNLPLPVLSQEFERILQRRHEKAGGRPDDPAFRELLSYFSRERLPAHVVTPGPRSGALVAAVGVGEEGPLEVVGGDAVRKGATITFSRSSTGELVTEAGGHVLGRVRSPALAAALFDLYLGDQPVSKKAKAAAGEALLRMADAATTLGTGSGSGAGSSSPPPYRYQLQSGERLVCPPGVSAGGLRGRGAVDDVSACLLELP